MLQAVEGVYREGKVELLEVPAGVQEARVIVTFLPASPAAGTQPPLTDAEVEELRWRLESWEEDWSAPGMEAYDGL
jgi:hypothetical protein